MKIPKAVRRALENVTDEVFEGWLRKKLEFIEGQNRRQFFATSTYVGDYTAITWITSGQRIFVDTRDLGIAQHLMFKGYWEKTTNQALLDLLEDDSVYVDVGAHYGYHVLTAAQRVKKGRVVAVEPNPRLYGLLEKSIRTNQLRERATLHHCAVSEAPAELSFVTPVDDPALGHIAGADEPDDGAPRTTVRCRALDDICADLDRVDLIKIDVEGHESQALRSARATIERHRPLVLMEYAPAHIERQQPVTEFHALLGELGFTHVYEIRGGRLHEARFDRLAEDRNLRNIVLADRALT
ncbi:MAG: FkbM family methyltransferase [Sandaracinaceae bacterium]|nr:MAG: FkbM family methyltransferase [Sandaracinaceae bacterium]